MVPYVNAAKLSGDDCDHGVSVLLLHLLKRTELVFAGNALCLQLRSVGGWARLLPEM